MSSCILLRGGGGGVDCENATARPQHVVNGYTFGTSTSEEMQSGSMPNNGAVNATINNPVGGTYTIPQGYHNGSGVVRGKAMPTQGTYTITPSTSTQTIPAGKYYTGDVLIAADADFVESNIRENVVIFGVTGTCPDYESKQTVWTM